MDALRTACALAVRDRRHSLEASLLVLTALAMLLYLAGIHGWLRELLALVVFSFLPGAAILSFLPRLNPLMSVGIAAAASLTLFTVLAYFLVAISRFEAAYLIWTVFPLAAAALTWREFTVAGAAAQQRDQRREADRSAGDGKTTGRRRRRRQRREQPQPPQARPFGESLAAARRKAAASARGAWQTASGRRTDRLALGALALGLLLWIFGVHGVDVADIGDYGLVEALPVAWPLGFALLLLTTALYAASGRPNAWIMALLAGGVIFFIYATPPAVYEAPHLPWVYKHVGVVNLLLDQGHAVRSHDIYNRWPSFFAVGGVFTRFSGAPGPVSFIGWAELYFITLQTVLVGAITWNETRRVTPTGLAALLFVLINWIGQAYFSPQAMAFTMMLAFFAIVFSQLYDKGNSIGRLLERLVALLTRRKQRWADFRAAPQWSTRVAVVAALCFCAGVAFTHQLTPYVLLIQLTLLTVAGFVRPRWLLLGCAAITIAYLLPNLLWVNDNYGLFSSLDPFNNVKTSNGVELSCSAACQLVSRISTLASAFSWLAGIIAILVLARRRPAFRIPLYGLAMFGAFVMIFGQSYGGEAALRVVMFSAPFAAILISGAVATFSVRWRSLLAAVLTIGLAVSFLYAYFGNEQYYYVTRDSVDSAEYLYEHAPAGSVVLYTAENYAGLLAGNYDMFPLSDYTGSSGLLDDQRLRNLPLGPAQVPYVIEDIESASPNGFVVFSDEMDNYAEKKGMSPPGQLEKLRQAMLASGRFIEWHRNGDVVIYRLIPAKE